MTVSAALNRNNRPDIQLTIHMDMQAYTQNPLWSLLVEAIHANVMYPTHKAYTRDVILKAQPDISADELALKLNMPLGEALVILQELQEKAA